MIGVGLFLVGWLFRFWLFVQLMLFINHFNFLINLHLIALNFSISFSNIQRIGLTLALTVSTLPLWFRLCDKIGYTFPFISLVLRPIFRFIDCYDLQLFFEIFLFVGLGCHIMLLFYFNWRLCLIFISFCQIILIIVVP